MATRAKSVTKNTVSKTIYKFVTWRMNATDVEFSIVFSFQASMTPIDHYNQAESRIMKLHDVSASQFVITSFPI